MLHYKQVAFSLRRQNDRLDLLNHLRYPVSLNQATVLKRTYVHKTLQKFSLFEQSFGENEIRNKTLNLFAPEPPVTARADPGPFYPL